MKGERNCDRRETLHSILYNSCLGDRRFGLYGKIDGVTKRDFAYLSPLCRSD